MRTTRRGGSLLFVAILAFCWLLISQVALAETTAQLGGVRITQPIDESQVFKLAGNTRPEANFKNDRGPVAANFPIEHILIFLERSAEQEQAVDKLMDELNDRKSPNFHHWLTAQEFGERFGVAEQDIQTVTSWLESHGFAINRVYPNRMLIDFSGTAGQVEEAFHTQIHQLEVKGQLHISNVSDPQIPAALAPVVKGIFSLNDFKPHPMYKSARQYTFADCTSDFISTCYALTPQDYQTIYNLNPLYTAGISGQGQTIALVEDTDVYNYPGDWNTYRSTFRLSSAFPLGTFTQVHPGGCTDPSTNSDDGEAAIDVEVASAIAPNAAIELISCPSGTVTFGGLIAFQNLLNGSAPYPGVVSMSYGICEAFDGNGGNAAFYNTFQQAAAQGVSVFVSSGDEGPSSCSVDFEPGSEYDVASLGVSGWASTPYNVAVGGTDFEDTYNSMEGGASLSSYWSSTNTSGYGSALSYIPEIPWNDACGSVLISEVAHSSFAPYGSTGTCNTSPSDSSYLSTGAGSGGASNCATGQGGMDQGDYGISGPQCQGYPKPSWQAGSSLSGGQAVYGSPSDGVRDIPDVSMFAANGVWGHYVIICWSDPNYTGSGSASCSGAPSTWSGFGGTSISSPTLAAIQALVNQTTSQSWGNPNPMYYQIAQNEYGAAGGTFQGSSCNSSRSGGPGVGCAFNDVTQGDIDLACTDNGTLEEAHCYLPSGTFGVDSTDVITAATVISGGTGYTSEPSCTIAGPTNNSAYKSPTGTTLWAGGTQATCTTTVSSGTTTAVWTVAMEGTDGVGDQIILANPSGSTTCGPYTLSGASTTAMASNLVTAIGSACSLATATSSSATVTITAKTAGYAGDFNVSFGTATLFNSFYVYITNTTKGQGPNYVSGITITEGGSGYQPDTPITLTGGGGSGAVAVANTSPGTAASTYQPAYGAAPGYDLATGLGSPNATNLVTACEWLPSASPGIFSPASGSTLTGTSALFQWNPKSSATNYWVDVGSTSGGNNYEQSGPLSVNSCGLTLNSLPNNGSTVYVTWWYLVNGSWSHTAYQYTAVGASSQKGVITSPTPGSTLGGGSVIFTWTPGSSATNYWIDAGNSAGSNQYSQSGPLGNVTSTTVNNLPTNGSTVYLTLYSMIGGSWFSNAYTYTALNAAADQATMQTPTPSSILSGNNVTFTWTAGTGVTQYWLDVGSSAGGNQYYQSRPVTQQSATVGDLPTNGSTVYATLYSYIGGQWVSKAYTYTAFNASSVVPAVMQSPTSGSTLTTNATTFTWNAGTNVSSYWLDIGTSPGGNNIYQSGSITAQSATVYVPPYGNTVYATLYSLAGGEKFSNAYTYTAVNGGQIASPTPGSTLPGSSATFTWSAGSATAYQLTFGSTYGGSNLGSSGIQSGLSYTATGLPTNGSTIYVTLYSEVNTNWVQAYYSYISGP